MTAGGYSLTYIDEFVDQLLREERVCDIILPRIAKREVLEENGEIGNRKSLLLEAMVGESKRGRSKSRSASDRSPRSAVGSNEEKSQRERSRSMTRSTSRSSSRYISRSPSRSRSVSRSPFRSRSRSVSLDRMDIPAT